MDRLIPGTTGFGPHKLYNPDQKEVAWTIKEELKLRKPPENHSDFESGFIRAEVVPYDTLVALGSMNAKKKAGQSEGKDYEIQEGDVVLSRFNV